jgi:YfiH family protein
MNRPTDSEIPPAPLVAFPGLPGVRAFFTTRAGGLSRGPYDSLNLGPHTGDDPGKVRDNWGLLLESQGLGGRVAVLPLLRHGAAMIEAPASGSSVPGGVIGEAGEIGEADAIFTHVPGTVIAVTMADCLAALVVDPESGCVAAVHAGWRGSRDNILGLSLARLFAEGRCRPESTRVALGPCLSADALEVGVDVAATLPQAHVRRIAGRPRFDLRGCNRAQAVAAGVAPEHVTDVAGCTRDDPARFFSHRRAQTESAGITGRMAACIALM